MVFFTVKRRRRAASCWSLLVVNGGTGFRFFSLVTTDSTIHCDFFTAKHVIRFGLILYFRGLSFDLHQLVLRTAAEHVLPALR